jgi:hypothetical protein
MVLSDLFDGVFFFGDLNYRVDLPRLEVSSFHCSFRIVL